MMSYASISKKQRLLCLLKRVGIPLNALCTYNFFRKVTPEDINQAIQSMVAILQYDPTKHVIVDASLVEQYPPLNTIKNCLLKADLRYTSAWVITFGFVHGIGQFLIAVALQLIQARFRTLKNLEESLAFLQEMDSFPAAFTADSRRIYRKNCPSSGVSRSLLTHARPRTGVKSPAPPHDPHCSNVYPCCYRAFGPARLALAGVA